MANLVGNTGDPNTAGVLGQNTNQTVEAGVGVHGVSAAAGVVGESSTWHGVAGFSQSTTGGQGVFGFAVGTGVAGVGKTWIGVYGETNAAASSGAAGIWGEGKEGGDGVKGHASGQGKAGVAGFHLTNQGPGIFGKGSPAGFFEGNVKVTGDVDARNINELTARIQAVPGLMGRVQALENRDTTFQQQFNNLQQQVNNLQQQVASLQQKHAEDVQGIAVSLATLAARVTALGG